MPSPSPPPLPVLTGEKKPAVTDSGQIVIDRVRKRELLRDVLIIAVAQFASAVCLLLITSYFFNIGPGRLLDTLCTAVYCLASILSYVAMGKSGRQPISIRKRRLFYDAIILESIAIVFFILAGKYDSWVTKGYEIAITTLCTLCAFGLACKTLQE